MAAVLNLVVAAVWFMLPAYAANMAPVFAKRYRFAEPLAIPVDLGLKIGKERIFGSHKTVRGFVIGVIAAVFTIIIQTALFAYIPYLQEISVIFYAGVNLAYFGVLLGAGALFGDLVKSFFKRRVGIPPGKDWHPFDELDFVIGALAAIALVQPMSLELVITILIISPILHVVVNRLGHSLKIKR